MNDDNTYEEWLEALLSTGIFVVEKEKCYENHPDLANWLYLKIIDSEWFLTILKTKNGKAAMVGWRKDLGLNQTLLETLLTLISKETLEKILFNIDLFIACDKIQRWPGI